MRIHHIETNVAYEALKIGLPNISMLPFEEILDIRLKMRDELLSFRAEIINLSFKFSTFDSNNSKEYISKYVNSQIYPQIVSLEKKLWSLDQKYLKKILNEVKDPKSYSPLVLSVFENVSNSLFLAVSMGLISINAAIEYFNNKKEVKSEGLYFLMALRERTNYKS